MLLLRPPPRLFGNEEHIQKRRENELHLPETTTDFEAKKASEGVNLE